jgi:hypothetical protein
VSVFMFVFGSTFMVHACFGDGEGDGGAAASWSLGGLF